MGQDTQSGIQKTQVQYSFNGSGGLKNRVPVRFEKVNTECVSTKRFIDHHFYPQHDGQICTSQNVSNLGFATPQTNPMCIFNNFEKCSHYDSTRKYAYNFSGMCPYHQEKYTNMRYENIIISSKTYFLPIYSGEILKRHNFVPITSLLGGEDNIFTNLPVYAHREEIYTTLKSLLMPYETTNLDTFSVFLKTWSDTWWAFLQQHYACLQELYIDCFFDYDTFKKFATSYVGSRMMALVPTIKLIPKDGIVKNIKFDSKFFENTKDGSVGLLFPAREFNILDQLVFFMYTPMNFQAIVDTQKGTASAPPNISCYNGYLVYGSGFGFTTNLNKDGKIALDTRPKKYLTSGNPKEELISLSQQHKNYHVVDMMVLQAKRSKESSNECMPLCRYTTSTEIRNIDQSRGGRII